MQTGKGGPFHSVQEQREYEALYRVLADVMQAKYRAQLGEQHADHYSGFVLVEVGAESFGDGAPTLAAPPAAMPTATKPLQPVCRADKENAGVLHTPSHLALTRPPPHSSCNPPTRPCVQILAVTTTPAWALIGRTVASATS